MAKPTLTQLKQANTGDKFSWGGVTGNDNKLTVKEQVVTVNGVDYVRDKGAGRESGLYLLGVAFGLEE